MVSELAPNYEGPSLQHISFASEDSICQRLNRALDHTKQAIQDRLQTTEVDLMEDADCALCFSSMEAINCFANNNIGKQSGQKSFALLQELQQVLNGALKAMEPSDADFRGSIEDKIQMVDRVLAGESFESILDEMIAAATTSESPENPVTEW